MCKRIFHSGAQLLGFFKHEYLTPEHILFIALYSPQMIKVCELMDADFKKMFDDLTNYIQTFLDKAEDIKDNSLCCSYMLTEVLRIAMSKAVASDNEFIRLPHLIAAILEMDQCYGCMLMKHYLGEPVDILSNLSEAYEAECYEDTRLAEVDVFYLAEDGQIYKNKKGEYENEFEEMLENGLEGSIHKDGEYDDEDDEYDDEDDDEDEDEHDDEWEEIDDDDDDDNVETITPEELLQQFNAHRSKPENEKGDWHKYVLCLNDYVQKHNPLIGREVELERTIEVLCRKDKNNALHIGEAGVGKTSITYGLAARIEAGTVPQKLQGARIYSLDLGGLIAGTQYRGEFEKRLKSVMLGASTEPNAIIFIDEIHNIVGTGQIGDSAMDASNMLKPYLEDGNVRFIGTTTYEEYNRYMGRCKGLLRRFQNIDIAAPSLGDAVRILEGLAPRYEEFHGVTFLPGILDYAARMADKYITDRQLPDKAIDLIDEVGAYRQLHPLQDVTEGPQPIDKEAINHIICNICRIDTLETESDQTDVLMDLQKRMLGKIYGQDEAVGEVVNSVLMSKAGLLDANKPIASLLFVGPTGVGKTEIARVLAHELHINLIRFDMSEYSEKASVAKLIGSPAGYVGYEDGGMLVNAIRKTPQCVLLLDEIEKAHSDLFNILLQVMDYATLTDNKGNKADFRNVILIMTSNVGAQFAKQANIGFNAHVSTGQAMFKEVKHTFKPEFLNRLSGIVTFRDMDQTMAQLILAKKLRELDEKLGAKNVTLHLTPAATEFLLSKGITREYGARELDRVIAQHIKKPLTQEILFGSLKEGGEVTLDVSNNQLQFI